MPRLFFADNTILSVGTGGDTIRDKDRSGVKTQIVALDLNPAGAESLMAGTMPVSSATATSFKSEVVGSKSDNSTNTATKLGVLSVVANAAPPVYTESNLNPLSTDLAGRLRVQLDDNVYIGRVCTFRIPGRAGTAGQKIFSIHNATGSTVTVRVRKMFIDIYQTVIKAVTVAPPVIRAWKVTVLPTNGTALTKVQIGGSGATSSSVTVLGDASSDGTGSATALTATLPAGAIISQEFAPRLITAAGYEMADRIEFFIGSTIKLAALEGVVVFLDYTLATQNPATDMWIVGCEWDEN